ncbi:MAG: 2-oxo acid dehydrogenase subunit E2 [Lachnospiraceae bacterium]|nr:2-oxo acid dehydrogenase subunit E2 [Lachnospiraceae bacterium]
MAEAVIMPKAGITVESCIIEKWVKKVGDNIQVGDVLFSYETDKTAFECESTAAGELLEIFFGDGEEVPCLVNVCAIGQHGEECSALRPAQAGGSDPAAAGHAPAPEAPAPEAVSAPAAPAPVRTGAASGAVSPRARKLAERAGVDPSLADGTGAGGRIIERDVRALMERGGAAQDTKTAGAVSQRPSGEAEAAYEDVSFTGIRKAISSAMYHSLSSMAQLTHNFSFDASTILAYRKLLKEGGGDTAQITIGDMILYAVAHTLLSCPDLNAHMLDDHSIRRFKHVNLGVAVDTPRGLMVPTVFRADEKSLLEISKELKELAEAARSGAISPDLLKDGTFTVSNLGAAGVESFTPVINPPQTALLGVCTTVDRVRKLPDGSIDVYPSMTLSMTYDHRAIDGAPLSRYVQGLCRNLESFTTLLAM